MSSAYTMSVRSLGSELGAQETHHVTVPVSQEWSTEVAQWTDNEFDLSVDLLTLADGVLATLSGGVHWAAQCSRCAEDTDGVLELSSSVVFFHPDADAVKEADEDDDDELYQVVDAAIDLEAPVRDELVLGLPVLPLCDPDCPGLCDVCGERWDRLPEDHSHQMVDPRWQALGNLLSSQGDVSDSGPEGN